MKLFSYEITDYALFQDNFQLPYDTEEENQHFFDSLYRKLSLNRFYQEYSMGSVAGYGASASVIQIQRNFDNKRFAAKIVKKDENNINQSVSKESNKQLDIPKWLLKAAREISVLKLVKSQNIVRLIDVVDTESHIFIIIEYIESIGICKDFLDFVTTNNYLAECDARYFFVQIVMGLYILHQSNIIHRDLKLSNLLLEKTGRIVIIDFGLSRINRITSDCYTFVGTPRYSAPEVLACNQTSIHQSSNIIDQQDPHHPKMVSLTKLDTKYDGYKADLWSLGVILYEMITGNSIATYENRNDFYEYISTQDIDIPTNISESLQSLLHSLLSRDPQKRLSPFDILHHPWCQDDIHAPLSFLEYPSISVFLNNPSNYRSFSLNPSSESFENIRLYTHPNTVWLDETPDSISSSYVSPATSQVSSSLVPTSSSSDYINLIRNQYSSLLTQKQNKPKELSENDTSSLFKTQSSSSPMELKPHVVRHIHLNSLPQYSSLQTNTKGSLSYTPLNSKSISPDTKTTTYANTSTTKNNVNHILKNTSLSPLGYDYLSSYHSSNLCDSTEGTSLESSSSNHSLSPLHLISQKNINNSTIKPTAIPLLSSTQQNNQMLFNHSYNQDKETQLLLNHNDIHSISSSSYTKTLNNNNKSDKNTKQLQQKSPVLYTYFNSENDNSKDPVSTYNENNSYSKSPITNQSNVVLSCRLSSSDEEIGFPIEYMTQEVSPNPYQENKKLISTNNISEHNSNNHSITYSTSSESSFDIENMY